MSALAPAAALALAAVFAWAGVAKLSRPPATAAAFRQLRLPAPRAFAASVPAGELALAAVLVARPRLGGLLALVTLTAFTAVLATRSGGGCGCFGAARRPAGRTVDLVRNGGLAVLAAACLPATAWTVPDLPAAVVTGTTVAAGAVLLALVDLRARAGRLWPDPRT